MKRLILGAVLIMLVGHAWAKNVVSIMTLPESVLVTGFYPNLSDEAAKDLCQTNAMLASSNMELRIKGTLNNEAEALENQKQGRGFWDNLGVPKEFHDVNAFLLKLMFEHPLPKDLSKKDELLKSISRDTFKLCFGQREVDDVSLG